MLLTPHLSDRPAGWTSTPTPAMPPPAPLRGPQPQPKPSAPVRGPGSPPPSRELQRLQKTGTAGLGGTATTWRLRGGEGKRRGAGCLTRDIPPPPSATHTPGAARASPPAPGQISREAAAAASRERVVRCGRRSAEKDGAGAGSLPAARPPHPPPSPPLSFPPPLPSSSCFPSPAEEQEDAALRAAPRCPFVAAGDGRDPTGTRRGAER